MLARRMITHWLGHLPRYRLRERPIFIFTMRRSGSTLLLRMFYSQPGYDYINEPLNLWLPHPHFFCLPHPPLGEFITLTPKEEARFAAFFDALLSGRLRLHNQWNPFHPYYSFVVRRLVVKFLNASTFMDWFARRYDADIVYFTRHPLAVAESIVRMGWARIADAYLDNPWFRETYLGDGRERLARDILARGSPYQIFVLEWCLKNAHMLRVWREVGAMLVTYEALLTRAGEVIDRLAARLNLPAPERMARDLAWPSRTAASTTRDLIARAGPRALTARWRERVPQEEIARAQEILDAFGVTLYRADSVDPMEDFVHHENART